MPRIARSRTLGAQRLRYRRQTDPSLIERERQRRLASRRSNTSQWWLSIDALTPTTYQGTNWDYACQYCNAPLLPHERFSYFCCSKGDYKLPSLPPYPQPFWTIILGNENISTMSRRLNYKFCFTAIGVAEGSFVHHDPPGRPQIPSSVCITGRVYHRILNAETPNHPIHWFLYDAQQRYIDSTAARRIPRHIIDAFLQCLTDCNPYIKKLQQAMDQTDTDDIIAIELSEDTQANDHEIAAVLHSSNTAIVHPRNILMWLQGSTEPIFISSLSRFYEPLQYPLLFPHGTLGWHPDNPYGLSQMRWYRARLLTEPRFSKLGRLTSEYLVDMFSRMEEERLNFILHSQVNADSRSPSNLGLSSSFLGSRRWCKEQVSDALALARKFGQPSLFVTMTCNPAWPEIQSQLSPGQHYYDIPVILARSFKGRLTKLKELLSKKFGTVVYMVHVIEFQKRGLPHAHVIIKYQPELPVQSFNELISAELPNDTDVQYKQKIEQFMIHTHTRRCQHRNRTCVYNYPKPVNENTTVDDRGYVQYRRRNSSDTNVVPHNKFLLMSLDCHINVEISSTVNIFAYLYKYLYKGPDSARYNLRNNGEEYSTADEIRDYIRGRYVSAPEAAWRILGYHITEKNPSVDCLPIHLPNRNIPQYRKKSSMTKLLRYLYCRPHHPSFDTLTYADYYETYILNTSTRTNDPNVYREQYPPPTSGCPDECILHNVKRRTRGVVICRLAYVPLNRGEEFYLRSLLQTKPARSYRDLRTVEGRTYNTFHEAALALGLFEHNNEAELVLREAVDSYRTPAQIRFLFCQLMVNGCPAVPLWNQFYSNLSADFEDRGFPDDVVRNETLTALATILQDFNKTLTDFGLPTPSIVLSTETRIELQYFINQRDQLLTTAERKRLIMNGEQQTIYDKIIESVTLLLADPSYCPTENLIFVEGKAGRGKTFLINAICDYVRGSGGIVLPCATTALAASNYVRGRTAHSMFGIPIHQDSLSTQGLTSTVSPTAMRADLLRNASVIIWDEIAMANKAAFECVDVLLRQLCRRIHVPFGGKLVLAVGDFRQVAPVIKNGSRQEVVMASIKHSDLWPSFHKFTLSSPIRNADDPDFADFVDYIGENDGQPPPSYPVNFNCIPTLPNFTDVCNFLYPNGLLDYPDHCAMRSFLSPLNARVDAFNAFVLEHLSGNNHVYHSSNSIKEEDTTPNDSVDPDCDFLNALTSPGVPNHTLTLKTQCVCSLMRNMSVQKGLVKNARVIVMELGQRHIKVALLHPNVDWHDPANHFLLARAIFEFSPPYTTWTVQRKQFPLRPAYATTFNSCQGLTLDRIVLDMTTPVFAHGQLYTALSRVRNRHHLRFLTGDDYDPDKIPNIVYTELL